MARSVGNFCTFSIPVEFINYLEKAAETSQTGNISSIVL